MTESDFNGVDFRALYMVQKGLCFYCGRPIQPRHKSRREKIGWTKDHFYPRSAGNVIIGNCVMACQACNLKKGSREPTDDEIRRFNHLVRKYNDRRGRPFVAWQVPENV